MLAYNADGVLEEFEETSFLAVCDQCHKLYHRSVSEQILGFREWEDDECPYCGFINGKSM